MMGVGGGCDDDEVGSADADADAVAFSEIGGFVVIQLSLPVILLAS